MIMKNIFKHLLILVFCLLLFPSCKKFVEVPQPKNQIVTSQVFADSTDANAAILGIYISMMNSPMSVSSGGMTLFPGLSSDELYQTANNTTYNQFYVDNIQPNNSTVNGLWNAAYSYIYSSNACIEGITASTGISKSSKNALIAEARFIRAFENFYLVTLYGPVPLVNSTNFSINRLVGRNSTDQVYAQIISDLQFAELNLTNGAGANDRPTSFAASALLAKVYLYNGKYDLAQSEASKVINSGNFSLETDLNNVFLSSSGETIWKLDPVAPNAATWEGVFFVTSSSKAIPKYVLTPSLYNAFEAGDMRQANWVQVNTVAGKSYPYPYKYKQGSTSTPVEGYVVLRLAEQYLIRAEAEANQNDLISAAADVDKIRTRAGLLNTLATDKAGIMSAIEQERRVEFFCEWGNRWFDLSRWNLASSILSPLKPNWSQFDKLYPIPSRQIDANPNLVQNPGY